MPSRLLLLLILGLGLAQTPAARAQPRPARTATVLQVPGTREFCRIDEKGRSVLPSGRYVTPAGQLVRITHDPFGLALAPDGRTAVTLHNGVFTRLDLASLAAVRVPSYDGTIRSPLSNGSFLGVAFSADSKKVYLSGGDNGAVIIYDLEKMQRLDSISLNGACAGQQYADSFTSDLVLNEAAHELLALDRANFRLVRLDLNTRQVTASVPVGRQPFGLALSPDGRTALVANVGQYAYPLITGATPKNADSIMISRHPYGNDTKESREGTVVEGRQIPGVGSPLAPEAMSVFAVDLATNRVVDRFKTGHQIGEMVEGAEVVGGASPNSLAVGRQLAYVTNATNDNLTVIDYRNHRLLGDIPLKVDSRLDKYRGLLPFGLCLSRDERTLYVALLGFNAVAVVDVATRTTRGLIPTGWGPARVRLSADEKTLYVTSCRGLGAGPNGGAGFVAPPQGTYIGDIQLGSFQKVPVPTAAQLAAYTKQVLGNTFVPTKLAVNPKNPLPALPGLTPTPIKYVVYITKENRTYDEVLGQLREARGDSTLARFGVNCEYTLPDSLRGKFAHLRVAPNHRKVARQFAFSDNYYCDSDASIHGHHWMLGVVPNEWVEANSNVSKTAKLFSGAPGRRFPGSTGSMDPEDYAETGGLWEALERRHVAFYNFGEANETAHNREAWRDTATGAGHLVMEPMQKALFPRTSHDYAGFNTSIPDQFRMEQFEREFTKKWLTGRQKMPALITMQVPNDHGADVRPADGYPYRQSYMADNDLALGRILHFLSRTPYWKNMLVVVTEDDPQGGVDHVDAHRSLLLLAGPYVKRGYVSHAHANFGAVLKTIYNLLGVPYVNQYDATGTLLQDFFTGTPDFRPYTLERSDLRIFDPQQAMRRYDKTIDWRKVEKGPEMDDEARERADHYRQQKAKSK
ncbi:bifunctional YncE family protein/alkaline phosphatase family protein [Hymenobacter caeli]|uniref:YVTN family beta-propeller protein n=1 Tax=Hymenobacter caeli TaxID=2735894 RepID=A0ABX2FWB4_9BACT|nr:bifunctional YncE family protein/alkaline phosphatase family protein [Hymenobacter caeli]NRT20675.1 YVTN family beta-propeller protein [Hymenobacter caeli]